MREQLPAPDFNTQQYERPQLNWICGRAAEGAPCRNGAGSNGTCGADFECSPALEKKAGETKGRFRCTRPRDSGGPCADGPRPDGACGRPVPKCSPARSLRSRRDRLTGFVVALTAALLLVGLGGPWRGRLINPGELSLQHSGSGFRHLAGAEGASGGECAVCHRVAASGLAALTQAALRSDPGPFDFEKLAAESAPNMTAIEEGCVKCHRQQREPHQPNVVDPPSCVVCHAEHRGRAALARTDAAHCVACHNDARSMLDAAVKGRTLPAHAFELPMPANVVQFKPPRTAAGYLHPFSSFWNGHPEFQIAREQRRETNTLRFNHQLHLGETVRLSGGSKLDCAYCHQPDGSGNFRQKLSYQAHCRECHEVQFDARNPELIVPHGDPAAVHAFIASLRTQYADLATRRGIRDAAAARAFVEEQERALLQEFASPRAIEERVFLGTKRALTGAPAGVAETKGVQLFNGCAYCHEVVPAVGDALPRVTKPVLPERWLFHSPFDHRQHAAVNCEQCHAASGSRDTADVLMPRIANCAECHRPAGGARSDCLACHQYHRSSLDLTPARKVSAVK